MRFLYNIEERKNKMGNTTINVRVDKELKNNCEKIFADLGIGMTTAIIIYLKAIERNNGIPFSLEIPNKRL